MAIFIRMTFALAILAAAGCGQFEPGPIDYPNPNAIFDDEIGGDEAREGPGGDEE